MILDYSTLYAEEPEKINEYLQQDSSLILMAILYELDETLGYIEAIGVVDGKAIFRTGEYMRELELIKNLGAYKSSAISRRITSY